MPFPPERVEIAEPCLQARKLPAVMGEVGAATSQQGLPFSSEEVDAVMNTGIDFKKLGRWLSEGGFSQDAYMLVVDAWRQGSPR